MHYAILNSALFRCLYLDVIPVDTYNHHEVQHDIYI